jgi:hypothetical protein
VNISLSRLDDVDTDGRLKDPFFDPASKRLLQGVKALAAGSQYPDLLTCLVMLLTKDLARRVEIANLDSSIKGHFSGSVNSSFSDSTREAIQTTAIDKLKRLLPIRLRHEDMELRRAELERILPCDKSASIDSTASESCQVFSKGTLNLYFTTLIARFSMKLIFEFIAGIVVTGLLIDRVLICLTD